MKRGENVIGIIKFLKLPDQVQICEIVVWIGKFERLLSGLGKRENCIHSACPKLLAERSS